MQRKKNNPKKLVMTLSEMMLIVIKNSIFISNFEQNGYISLSFFAACRITLSPFSQTRSERHIFQVPPVAIV